MTDTPSPSPLPDCDCEGNHAPFCIYSGPVVKEPSPSRAGERPDPQWLKRILAEIEAGENKASRKELLSRLRLQASNYEINIAEAYDKIDKLEAKLRTAQQERDAARAEAQDWQLAADGIKHHFHCANNVVTGDPRGSICDRCRAETAEAQLIASHQTIERLRELLPKWRGEVPNDGGPWEAGEAYALNKCITELEAALTPPADGPRTDPDKP